MALPVTEFIYFQLKSSVKPEDPASEEGQALLNLFTNTKQQSGYQNSGWGRTKEDENIVVWAIGSFVYISRSADSARDQETQPKLTIQSNTRLGRRARRHPAQPLRTLHRAEHLSHHHLHHAEPAYLRNQHAHQEPRHRALRARLPQHNDPGRAQGSQRRPDQLPRRVDRELARGVAAQVLGYGLRRATGHAAA